MEESTQSNEINSIASTFKLSVTKASDNMLAQSLMALPNFIEQGLFQSAVWFAGTFRWSSQADDFNYDVI